MIFTIAKVEVRLFFTKWKMIFGVFFGKWSGVWNKNIGGRREMGVEKKKCIIFFNDFSNQNSWDKKFFDNRIFINFASNPKTVSIMEKIKLQPSGISDFEVVRRDNLYYVDKTKFISVLEHGDSYVFFGRPRRFGKSLFVSMLEAYYDIKNKDRFDELFSGLWIHEHPTERRGFYQVMLLDNANCFK